VRIKSVFDAMVMG